jgi:hypothetical protein
MTAPLPLIVLGLAVAVAGFVINAGLITFLGSLIIAAGVLLFFVTGQRTRPGTERRR